MFRFFETLVDPFPPGEPREPPRKLLPFLLHISRPVLPWLALMSVLTALVSVAEVALFGYIGSLVDWLADADRGSFLAEHGKGLALVALAIAIGLPMLVLAQSLVVHQTIFGNYPMLVRWIGHRYVLRQSPRFFQDELAGRISQKIMQTALATRETVVTLMDVMVYVVVYFAGTVVLVGQTDIVLTLPLIAWLGGYIALL
ncbi:MAG: ABC transporter ATP-binding protein, partial [Gammaproteobacteria bacterium]